MDRSGSNHKMMIKMMTMMMTMTMVTMMMMMMMMAEAFILSGADWRSNEVGWMASEEEQFASDTPDHPCQHSRG